MLEAIKPLLRGPVRHTQKYLKDPKYRQYLKIRNSILSYPRFKELEIKVDKYFLRVPDGLSLLSIYEELFLNKIYEFKWEEKRPPRILDIGANIGLSILFFREFYKDAEITAIEADPNIFSYLKYNLEKNYISDIELINKAAWDENTKLIFSSEGADGGRVGSLKDNLKKVEIEAMNMSEFCKNKTFDFIKIDIEGAETKVLPAMFECLNRAQYCFVEFHSTTGEEQKLSLIIATIEQAGFRVFVQSLPRNFQPLKEVSSLSGFDLQLNIFGTKNPNYI